MLERLETVVSEAALAPGRASVREPLLWLALAAALSPTLLDFVEHAAQEPWARPFLLVGVLGLASAWRNPRRARPRPFGWLLVAAGVGFALLTVGGGMTRLGRPGLPLAIVGMALALGRPVLPIALLACWAVPPPKALLTALSPGLESALAWAAVGVTRSLGGTASFVKDDLLLNDASLLLDAPDGGLPWRSRSAGSPGGASRATLEGHASVRRPPCGSRPGGSSRRRCSCASRWQRLPPPARVRARAPSWTTGRGRRSLSPSW